MGTSQLIETYINATKLGVNSSKGVIQTDYHRSYLTLGNEYFIYCGNFHSSRNDCTPGETGFALLKVDMKTNQTATQVVIPFDISYTNIEIEATNQVVVVRELKGIYEEKRVPLEHLDQFSIFPWVSLQPVRTVSEPVQVVPQKKKTHPIYSLLDRPQPPKF